MASLIPFIKFREVDNNGLPLSGGKLYSYLAGTTTPVATYTDESGITPNTNPVILDGAGRASVWLSASTSYKFILTDVDDNPIYTEDNVLGGSGSSSLSDGWSAWTEHLVTDGQTATDLSGETIDLTLYSSAEYMVEVIRGTTVSSSGPITIKDINGTGVVDQSSVFLGPLPHGVTFSVSQLGNVLQLRAALDSGPGNGTIKLSRRLVPA